MISVGIDVVNFNRFNVDDKYFVKRILTLYENNIFNNLNSNDKKQKFLAKTWALKEAIFKANNDFKMLDIVLQFNEGQKPICLNNNKLKLSLSYCDSTITAIAIYYDIKGE